MSDVAFQSGQAKVRGHMYNMGLLLKSIRTQYQQVSDVQWSLEAISDRMGVSRGALSHIELSWEHHERGLAQRATSLTEIWRLYALALLYPVALNDDELGKANVVVTRLARALAADKLPNGHAATRESITTYAEELATERMPYIVALAVKERAGSIDRTTIGEVWQMLQRSDDTEAVAALEKVRAVIAASRTNDLAALSQ